MNIIIFILTLGLLVLVHELGHFLAAKKNGVKVEEFGFGLPPRLFGIKKGETLYSINLLPIGGFVKLYGEELHEIKTNKLKNRAFINKTPWQKAMIIVSGVIGNFILGWALISFLFTQGVPVPTKKIIIEKVADNSPAQSVGLKTGDVIVNFADKNLENTQDLISLSRKYADKKIKIVIERNNQKINKEIIPRKNPPPGQGPLGVIITNYIERKYPWYLAPFYGLKEAFNITFTIASQLFKILFELIT
ncbi:MAG: M50 family metallopeptidase, partial [Microgenomates group bacterium]